MKRLVEDLLNRADFDQPPSIHHGDAIDELGHQAHVVADQDHGRPELRLHRVQRIHHLPLDHDVEGAGRLVGNNDLRTQTDAHGDADALLHPAAQLVWVHVRDAFAESDRLHELGDTRLDVLSSAARIVRPDRVAKLMLDAHDRIERVHGALRNQRDSGEAGQPHLLIRQSQQIAVAQENLATFNPTGRPDQPLQCQRNSGLARSRFAHQTELLALTQAETDLFNRFHRAPWRVVPDP